MVGAGASDHDDRAGASGRVADPFRIDVRAPEDRCEGIEGLGASDVGEPSSECESGLGWIGRDDGEGASFGHHGPPAYGLHVQDGAAVQEPQCVRAVSYVEGDERERLRLHCRAGSDRLSDVHPVGSFEVHTRVLPFSGYARDRGTGFVLRGPPHGDSRDIIGVSQIGVVPVAVYRRPFRFAVRVLRDACEGEDEDGD